MAQAVVDYVTAVNDGFAAIGLSVDNVVADINKLNAKILELENSPDKVTAADQQLITDSLAIMAGLKAKAVALDDMTAPDAAPEPPVA
jgi:hypothetical protein